MKITNLLAYGLVAALTVGSMPMVQVSAADTRYTNVAEDSDEASPLEDDVAVKPYTFDNGTLTITDDLYANSYDEIAALSVTKVILKYDLDDEQKLWDVLSRVTEITLSSECDTTNSKPYVLKGKVPDSCTKFTVNCAYLTMDRSFKPNKVKEFYYGTSYIEDNLSLATNFEETDKYGEGKQTSNFQGDEYLQKIVWPVNLKRIDQYAFDGCSALTTALTTTGLTPDQFPRTLKEIGPMAFNGCIGLKVVNTSDCTNLVISPNAFDGCTGVDTVYLGTMDKLWGYAFKDCSNLTKVKFGQLDVQTPNEIGDNAFVGCDKLTLDHIYLNSYVADLNEGYSYTDTTNTNSWFTTFKNKFPASQWDAILGRESEQHTINFYGLRNGGGTVTKTVNIGSKWADVLAEIDTSGKNDGVTFVGWYYDAKFVNPFKDAAGTITKASATALYAKYSDDTGEDPDPDEPVDPSEKKTITFIGGVTSPVTVEAYIGDSWSDITDKVDTSDKKNQRFEGWYTDASRTRKFAATGYLKKTDPTTLYALYYTLDDPDYVYTVTIRDILGNENKLYVNKNTTTTLTRSMLAEYEERDDLVFDTWRYPAETVARAGYATGEEVQFPVTLTGDLTIYSTWKARVSFNTMGGNELEPIMVSQGYAIPDAIHRIPTPAYTGRQFDGWYLDSAYETKFNYGYIFEKNTTLYAKWTSLKYKVQFNYLISDPVVVEVDSGDTVSQPTTPSATDMTFQGWSTTTGAIQTPFNFGTPIDKDTQLYAMWRIPVTFSENYTKSSDTNNNNNNNSNNNNNNTQDDGTTTVSVYYGGKVSKPTDPTREGNWKFGGWYTTSDCQDAFNFNTAIKSKRTLYAKWIDTTKADLKVVFNTVLDSSTTVDVKEDDVVEMPANPTHSGATFAGWYLDQGYTQKFDATQPIKNNMTVYAKWTVKVTFYPNNNTSEVTSDVLYNSTVSKVVPTAVNGYIFYNWYTDSLFGNVFDFGTKLTEDTNLYARWVTPAEFEQLKITDAAAAASSPSATPTTPGATIDSNGNTVPKTADNTPVEMLELLFALLGAAAVGIAGTLMYMKRRSKNV